MILVKGPMLLGLFGHVFGIIRRLPLQRRATPIHDIVQMQDYGAFPGHADEKPVGFVRVNV
jgi:hypothetical protein